MKPQNKFALIAAICLILSLLPRPGYACSCVAPGPTPLETLEASIAVFSGEVVAVDAPESLNGITTSADPVKYTFDVEQVWKGPVQPALTVTTARDDASCGYPFEVGQSYLVYATGHVSGLITHTCTRNQPLASAGEDLAALGQGSVPPAPAPDPVPILAAALIVAAAAAGGMVLWRRKRQSV